MKKIIPKIGLFSGMMLLLLLAAPITALADGGVDGELTQTAGGYQVALVFEEPLASGENQIHIQVLDAHGQPVSKALVEVAVTGTEDEHSETEGEADHAESNDTAPVADSHGEESMSEPLITPASQDIMGVMEGSSEIEPTKAGEHEEMEMVVFYEGHEAGEFEGEIEIPGAGDWNIRVHVTVDESLTELDFLVHVAGSQTGKNMLLGFFTINAVILGAAFTMKLKSAA